MPGDSSDPFRPRQFVKSSAIIVAAGTGTRLGSGTPKAFVELGGRSLLW